ncbi:hypothetical protein O181_036698 [Austropuccinia psidii MF-1]|uniref:Glucose-methanol-choline oxidoreductase N-terminal domain-containing protein n=1 Tax=Austropuccinia psidii MF-1 TaxID=1389203 RepID=A0A9Q3D7Y4_9BASI|nr:hypothetical protein [Austropuccinia psidii MF-1]
MFKLKHIGLILLAFAINIEGSLLDKHDQDKCFLEIPTIPILGSVFENKIYDYIIIGAGTAGMALGARLSEDPNIRVAVLESGVDFDLLPLNKVFVNTPGADVLGCGSKKDDYFQDLVDWGFMTEPQTGANNRSIRYARGKTIGGTSTRNFMIYQRASKGAIDSWADLTGDPSWNFDDRWSDYQKSVSFTPPKHELRQEYPQAQYNPLGYTQSKGPIQVSYPNTPQDFSKYMQLSLNEKGVPTTQDFNLGNLMGVQYASTTINPRNGHRSSSRDFFEAARSRPNLVVYTGTTAKRILFDNALKIPRAVGVNFHYHLFNLNVTVELRATQEVIVSAGVFQSPQLLMVSGIGPRDQLVANNIPVLVENPNVGQGMEDHIFFGPTYPVHSIFTFTDLAADPLLITAQELNFTFRQLGPLTNNVADMIAFERIDDDRLNQLNADVLSSYPTDWPHIEYLSSAGVTGNFSGLIAQNSFASLTEGRNKFATILGALVAPRSRGTVKIISNDASVLPIIDPAWLTDPVDQRVAVEVFKRIREFFASESMQLILDGEEYLPGTSVQSDDAILDWIRDNLMTVWHAACTCSMRTKDKGGVIDSEFRVYGTQNLRVVDASSFPSLPPGHPQATIYMMAERATDLIKKAQQSHRD